MSPGGNKGGGRLDKTNIVGRKINEEVIVNVRKFWVMARLWGDGYTLAACGDTKPASSILLSPAILAATIMDGVPGSDLSSSTLSDLHCDNNGTLLVWALIGLPISTLKAVRLLLQQSGDAASSATDKGMKRHSDEWRQNTNKKQKKGREPYTK